MSDILKICNEIETQMFAQYGDPIAKVKGNRALDSERIRFTYYVSRLMEERGHKWIRPAQINGEHENLAYYSEKALQEAFEAGMLLAKADAAKMREQIRREVKEELMEELNNM
jgi:hypothetical protein